MNGTSYIRPLIIAGLARSISCKLAEVLAFSGGQSPEQNQVRRITLFPIYFSQRSSEPHLSYTALFPLGGHLENRMFRDDIKFVMFPIYSETRNKDVVTDNYFYPIFDRRRGGGLTGESLAAGRALPQTAGLCHQFDERCQNQCRLRQVVRSLALLL